MTTLEKDGKVAVVPSADRLHHNAYPVADQERTRHFYEDLIGLPLVQFWIEDEHVLGERHVYSHAFYGLKDGGALAFFNFADTVQAERYHASGDNPFYHISLSVTFEQLNAIRDRLTAAGYDTFVMEHGYTKSLYVRDPDGMRLEFSVDPANADAINEMQRRTAHNMLEYWQNGGRNPNNDVRHLGD